MIVQDRIMYDNVIKRIKNRIMSFMVIIGAIPEKTIRENVIALLKE